MSPSLEAIRERQEQDRLRLTEHLRRQTPMTTEEWQKQLEVFEKAGRDTDRGTAFWRRWPWKKA